MGQNLTSWAIRFSNQILSRRILRIRLRKTDNGNAMLQSFLSKLPKLKPPDDSLVPPLWGKRGKKTCLFFNIIRSRCCTRRSLYFNVENIEHAHHKQLTRRYAFDLDIETTHGQPASCRAMPVNVDDGLEDIKCIRGQGGEKLPAAPHALLPNLKKGLFCHRRGIKNCCRLFSTQQRPNVFVSDASPAPATYHRSFCKHCDQRVGRSP